MKSVSNDFLKQNFFLVEFAHIQNLFCFQLLKNWKSFCWLTNKRFISSAKSKHKKTECWFLVNHETLVVYKWVKTPFVFDCQLCCSLISRFLILVRLSCLLSCLSSCLFFLSSVLSCLNYTQLCHFSPSFDLSNALDSLFCLNSILINSDQLSYFFHPFSSSFHLSNLPLDSWYSRLFLFYSKYFLSNAT